MEPEERSRHDRKRRRHRSRSYERRRRRHRSRSSSPSSSSSSSRRSRRRNRPSLFDIGPNDITSAPPGRLVPGMPSPATSGAPPHPHAPPPTGAPGMSAGIGMGGAGTGSGGMTPPGMMAPGGIGPSPSPGPGPGADGGGTGGTGGSLHQPGFPPPPIPPPGVGGHPPMPAPPVNKQAKRLYVGNIPPNTTEEEIKDFFANSLRAHGIIAESQPNPVGSATVNLDKSFAFPEFVSPDIATRTLPLDGALELRGHMLRIRRPSNYTAPPTAPPEIPSIQALTEGAMTASLENNPDRLVITHLPEYMTDNQIRELLVVFGPLKMFYLSKDPSTGVSRGIAVAEFTHPESKDKALTGLHGTEMGDQRLQVRPASDIEDVMSLFPSSAEEATRTLVSSFLNSSVRVESILTGLAQAGLGPTRILVLLNMVTAEQVANDEVYAETYEDVSEECSQHGQVRSIHIARPLSLKDIQERQEQETEPSPSDSGSPTQQQRPSAKEENPPVKIYVEYENEKEAQTAQTALMGRKYAGRTVIVSFCDENQYFKEFSTQENHSQSQE